MGICGNMSNDMDIYEKKRLRISPKPVSNCFVAETVSHF